MLKGQNNRIPGFESYGYLPPGIHIASIDEIEKRFGASPVKRIFLTQHLKTYLEFISPFAVKAYIDGSYVSSKLAPGDIDIIIVLPEDFGDNIDRIQKQMFFTNQYPKFRLHIFAYKEKSQVDKVDYYLKLFQKVKNDSNKKKGILEVEL